VFEADVVHCVGTAVAPVSNDHLPLEFILYFLFELSIVLCVLLEFSDGVEAGSSAHKLKDTVHA
jgi:hypothetical protein